MRLVRSNVLLRHDAACNNARAASSIRLVMSCEILHESAQVLTAMLLLISVSKPQARRTSAVSVHIPIHMSAMQMLLSHLEPAGAAFAGRSRCCKRSASRLLGKLAARLISCLSWHACLMT